MANLKYWVWLASVWGLRAAAARTLLERFGGPREIFFAPGTELEGLGLRGDTLTDLRSRDLGRAEAILAACEEQGLQIITLQDSLYPERLKNIADPPTVLYVKGRLPVLDEEAAVALVGAREATAYGLVTAEKFGVQIAEHGGVVVSGMARGVDAAAHRGALKAGGITVAVLGSGADVVYPPENRRLYDDIAATGAVISEFPPGTPPRSANFPYRNRIISGLSMAVTVIEASRRSGSLGTVSHALAQGREVFAVPGNVDAANSEGCNDLIREGAVPATCGWDILRELEPLFPGKLNPRPRRKQVEIRPQAAPDEPVSDKPAAEEPPLKRLAGRVDRDGLSQEERTIYDLLLERDAMTVDDIVEATQIPTSRVLSALTMLELEGAVTRDANRKFSVWEEQL